MMINERSLIAVLAVMIHERSRIAVLAMMIHERSLIAVLAMINERSLIAVLTTGMSKRALMRGCFLFLLCLSVMRTVSISQKQPKCGRTPINVTRYQASHGSGCDGSRRGVHSKNLTCGRRCSSSRVADSQKCGHFTAAKIQTLLTQAIAMRLAPRPPLNCSPQAPAPALPPN